MKNHLWLWVTIAIIVLVFISMVATFSAYVFYPSIEYGRHGVGNRHLIILWRSVTPDVLFYAQATVTKEKETPIGRLDARFMVHMRKHMDSEAPARSVNHLRWMPLRKLLTLYKYNVWSEGIPLCGSFCKGVKEYFQFWNDVRPTYRKCMRLAMADIGVPAERLNKVGKVVFHVRCSDSPMNKEPLHTLARKKSVLWSLDALRKRGILPPRGGDIIMLNCTNWHSSGERDQKVCSKIFQTYWDILREAKVNVTEQCNSVVDDIVTMMQAPAVMTMGSSLAFSAVLAGRGLLVEMSVSAEVPDHGEWTVTRENIEADNRAGHVTHILHSPIRPVLHSEIRDYYDIPHVVERMLSDP